MNECQAHRDAVVSALCEPTKIVRLDAVGRDLQASSFDSRTYLALVRVELREDCQAFCCIRESGCQHRSKPMTWGSRARQATAGFYEVPTDHQRGRAEGRDSGMDARAAVSAVRRRRVEVLAVLAIATRESWSSEGDAADAAIAGRTTSALA